MAGGESREQSPVVNEPVANEQRIFGGKKPADTREDELGKLNAAIFLRDPAIPGKSDPSQNAAELQRYGFGNLSLIPEKSGQLFDLEQPLVKIDRSLSPTISPALALQVNRTGQNLEVQQGGAGKSFSVENSSGTMDPVWRVGSVFGNGFGGMTYRQGDSTRESALTRDFDDDTSMSFTRDHFTRRPSFQLARKISDQASFEFSIVPHDRLGPRPETSVRLGISIRLDPGHH